MKEGNNKNLVIVLLVIIIVILLSFVILVLTNTITFNSNNNTVEEDDVIEEGVELLKNEDAINVIKEIYGNEDVRSVFNQAVAFCGDVDDAGSIMKNGFSYRKSLDFNSFLELDNYLKNYMTESLLQSINYNYVITNDYKITNEIVTSDLEVESVYYEQDGSLYCNTWGKGGNLALEEYSEDETTIDITSVDVYEISATINAVYYDSNSLKTEKKINVSVISNNGKWLLNSYEEI